MAQAQWQEFFQAILGNGVVQGQLNSYVVTTTSGLGISVASGKATIQGFYARSDAAIALTCAAADPTNPRIDRAVLHADLTAHTLTVLLLTGTPAPSPVPPALTQTATVWEISLYQVRVNATQTVLTAGSLTDERPFSGLVNKGGDAMTGALTISAGTTTQPDTLKLINPTTPAYTTVFGTTDTGSSQGPGWYAYDAQGVGYIFSGATKNGINWFAPFTRIGNQGTAGSFGVPVIVAQALRVNGTVSGIVTILSYAVVTSGVYRVSLAWHFANGTVPQTVTLRCQWTDPDGGTPTSFFQTDESPSRTISNASIAASPFSTALAPMVISAASGANIVVSCTVGGGTPNDFYSAIIERLA